MGYFYLDELEKNPVGYDVHPKPPPAQTVTASVRRGSKDGDEIYSDPDLLTSGKGKFALDKTKVKPSDSPIVVVFKAVNGDSEAVGVSKEILLADPQPGAVTAPKSAVLGKEVELKVASWSAVTGETAAKEGNAKRISQDVKDSVKWQVDGEDISGTGEKVTFTIEEKHLGKELVVEAYVGTPSGRAKGKIQVYKLASVDPAGDTKKWYVNLPLTKDEPDAPNGRDVTIKAHVEPAAAGVTVYFYLSDNTGTRTLAGDTLSDNVKAKLAAASATTDKDGVASVKLTLSTYGGDKQHVFASLSKGASESDPGVVKSCDFEVWRKINLEVDIQSGLSDGGATADLKTTWEKLFIETADAGSNDSPPKGSVTQAQVKAGTWQKAFRSVGGKDQPPKPPAYLQLVYVQDIATGIKTEPQTFTRPKVGENEAYDDPVVGTYETQGYVFDPENWFVSCPWSSGAKKGKLLKDENVTLELGVDGTGKNAGKTVDRLTIKSSDEYFKTPKNDINITLTFRHMTVLSGYSYLETAVVAVGIAGRKKLDADDTKKHLLCCALHETGHSLGLATTKTARKPAEDLVKQNITESSKVSGDHCHEGTDECILYNDIPSTPPVPAKNFCNYCEDGLRARDIKTPGKIPGF